MTINEAKESKYRNITDAQLHFVKLTAHEEMQAIAEGIGNDDG